MAEVFAVVHGCLPSLPPLVLHANYALVLVYMLREHEILTWIIDAALCADAAKDPGFCLNHPVQQWGPLLLGRSIPVRRKQKVCPCTRAKPRGISFLTVSALPLVHLLI